MWRAIKTLIPAIASASLVAPDPASADSVIATRNIPARQLITAEDVTLSPAQITGAARTTDEVIGRESKGAIYKGRPLRLSDITAPAIIERNALVMLEYRAGGLTIRTEGRALGRAGAGEMIRVMNLASKTTLSGRVSHDGTISVGATP